MPDRCEKCGRFVGHYLADFCEDRYGARYCRRCWDMVTLADWPIHWEARHGV